MVAVRLFRLRTSRLMMLQTSPMTQTTTMTTLYSASSICFSVLTRGCSAPFDQIVDATVAATSFPNSNDSCEVVGDVDTLMLMWKSTIGEHRSWSDIVSATSSLCRYFRIRVRRDKNDFYTSPSAALERCEAAAGVERKLRCAVQQQQQQHAADPCSAPAL